MRWFMTLAIAGIGMMATPAMAQPGPAQHAEARPQAEPWFHEAYPPGSVGVPGVPGAAAHRDVPEGYILIEGDIQVPLEEYAAYINGEESTFGTVNFWSSIVPFSFSANVDAANQQRAINAMAQISQRAGITFVARTNQSDFIRFNDSTGNNSPVGRQGGQQTINIVSWSNQIVIVHELFHSLGFWHEQSRPDRATFITINLANVCQDCCSGSSCNSNFLIQGGASTYGFYDFDSLMHYGRTAFSTNGMDTIIVNQPFTAQWQNGIGQRSHFSFLDEITVRGIYRFISDRWWKPGASGSQSGNLPNPINNPTFTGAYNATPAGGTLFIRDFANYPAVGTYSTSMTIMAPTGARLGN